MLERYSRQILFEEIGESGQERLLESRAVIIGSGALGTAQAEALARAGVGRLRIVDRDFVEASNLQRQTMFTESDARERLPKAVACVNHLAEINSDIRAEAEIADVNSSNIERLIQECDIVLDGTDNFATRYLINDACVKHDVSWIYGGAVGSSGVTMTIRPHRSPCLRCIFEEAPPAGSAPTCDTAGIIMPIISIVAAVQVSEALKLLTGKTDKLHRSMMQFDVWENRWISSFKNREPSPDCPTCGLGRYGALEAENGDFATSLCGRDAIQVMPRGASRIDLMALAQRLRGAGEVQTNAYLLRLKVDEYELTIFKDARAIIRGTDDVTKARTLYAKYIGN